MLLFSPFLLDSRHYGLSLPLRSSANRNVQNLQAAVAACQVAVHCRRAPDLGFMSLEEFREALRTARAQPSFLPTESSEAVLLRSGYLAHVQQARPPPDAISAPLPRAWAFAEPVTIREVLPTPAASVMYPEVNSTWCLHNISVRIS